MILYMSAWRR